MVLDQTRGWNAVGSELQLLAAFPAGAAEDNRVTIVHDVDHRFVEGPRRTQHQPIATIRLGQRFFMRTAVDRKQFAAALNVDRVVALVQLDRRRCGKLSDVDGVIAAARVDRRINDRVEYGEQPGVGAQVEDGVFELVKDDIYNLRINFVLDYPSVTLQSVFYSEHEPRCPSLVCPNRMHW